jgi:hypothetical protein
MKVGPGPGPGPSKHPVSLRLHTVKVDDQTWAAAQAQALVKGETVSAVIRRALRRYGKAAPADRAGRWT